MIDKRHQWIVCVSAIVGLVIVETAALCTGHDGQVMMLVVAAISGLGGFSLARAAKRD